MFFRQLNIPAIIVDEVRANVLKAFSEDKYMTTMNVVQMNSIHYPQSLKKWFNQRGFFPYQAIVFVNYAGTSSPIHTDLNLTTYPEETAIRPTNRDKRLAVARIATEVPHENVLNIGIQNFIKTPVILYDCGEKWLENIKKGADLVRPLLLPEVSTAVEIDRYHLKHPVILNTTIPHKITNNTDEIRISISYRFHEDPLPKLLATDFL